MDRQCLPDAHMVVMCPLLTWFTTALPSPSAKGHAGTLVILLLLLVYLRLS